ncbi:MAG: 4-(cytidine 5'-diphospho)-2-C-methyl-D-erythritol kinase [Bacteroidetes bacterium]|nr:4-(cytidine 5'-diphospho)-2-C-methyl-D-erythritol kinase [Bacteroidota bacterium]
MQNLTLECHAKINVGLFIKGKRPDGYHDLETLFVPVHQYHDVLYLEKISASYPSAFVFGGHKVQGAQEDNLVYRAYQLLKSQYPKVGNVRIELQKNIPVGAGLGGGSSNAAHTLVGLSQLFKLDLGVKELLPLAAQLGSDVPFFLYDEPMLATGRGEVLQKFDFAKPKTIRIITPDVQINTAEAYQMLNLADCHTGQPLRPLLEQSPDTWRRQVVNDFEKPVFDRYPELAGIKEELYQSGATYAGMSGSGSAVYGLFY